METFTPLTAAAGGILIGIAAVIMMIGNGRITGISGIAGGLLASADGDKAWRLAFVGGLVLAPLLWKLAGFTLVIPKFSVSLPLMVIGGLIVGFGTRVGGGCTSGHGVCGISRFSGRSIVATVTFMITGVITVFVLRHVVGG